MVQLKHMVLALTGLVLAPTLSFAQTYSSDSIGLSIMNLNAATLRGQMLSMSDIWGRMRQDFHMTEVNPEIIRRQEQYYANNSAYFNRTVNRSQPYLYHILSEVEKRQMPAEIALLPFIESAFVTKAKSPVGASGLWQFMPATGRHYGLEQTNLYDGRHDIYAATDAALNYLQYLHGLFGDWSLALAAYNWGEGNVGKAVARAQAAGLDPVYENLRMPNETRNYVPKLLAVRNIINNPQAFGVNLTRIDNKPYFEAINVDKPLDIQAAARLANIPTSEFLALNPSFNGPVFVPKDNRKMLLPISAVNTFENNYRKADKNSLLSWNLYTTLSNTNVSDLAAETGMSASEIKQLNGIRGNTITAGRSVLLGKNSINTPALSSFANNDNDSLLRAAMAKADMAPVLPARSLSNIQMAAAPVKAATVQTTTVATPVQIAAIATTQAAAADLAIAPTVTPAVPMEAAAPAQIAAVATAQTAVAPTEASAIQTVAIAAPAQTTTATGLVGTPAEALAAQTVAAATPTPTPTVAVAIPQTVTTQPALAQADSAQPAAANVAVAENTLSGNQNNGDPLLTLAQESSLKLNAAEAVQDALAKADAEESRQARLAQARAERAAKLAADEAANNDADERSAQTHKVASGETLFAIAQRYNLNVADLITANRLKGSNIHAGQVLNVAINHRSQPQAKQDNIRAVSYTVKRGDTLSSIAARLNVPVSTLQKFNKSDNLRPGQKIKLTNM